MPAVRLWSRFSKALARSSAAHLMPASCRASPSAAIARFSAARLRPSSPCARFSASCSRRSDASSAASNSSPERGSRKAKTVAPSCFRQRRSSPRTRLRRHPPPPVHPIGSTGSNRPPLATQPSRGASSSDPSGSRRQYSRTPSGRTPAPCGWRRAPPSTATPPPARSPAPCLPPRPCTRCASRRAGRRTPPARPAAARPCCRRAGSTPPAPSPPARPRGRGSGLPDRVTVPEALRSPVPFRVLHRVGLARGRRGRGGEFSRLACRGRHPPYPTGRLACGATSATSCLQPGQVRGCLGAGAHRPGARLQSRRRGPGTLRAVSRARPA